MQYVANTSKWICIRGLVQRGHAQGAATGLPCSYVEGGTQWLGGVAGVGGFGPFGALAVRTIYEFGDETDGVGGYPLVLRHACLRWSPLKIRAG